jgi:hypothetical protein
VPCRCSRSQSLVNSDAQAVQFIDALIATGPCAYVPRQQVAKPAILVQNITCSGILLGVILAIRSGLYAALDAYGF